MLESNTQSSPRISREELYRDLVFSLSRRSTCLRAQVGAIVVQGKTIIGMGYNGAPPGVKHCKESGLCLQRSGYRCRRTIHAEANALIHSTRGILKKAIEGKLKLVSTHAPCLDCLKLCIAFGIQDIVFYTYYNDEDRDAFLEDIGPGVINLEQLRIKG